jgi:hypothetical protein
MVLHYETHATDVPKSKHARWRIVNCFCPRSIRGWGGRTACIFGTTSVPIAGRTIQLSSPRRGFTAPQKDPYDLGEHSNRIRSVESTASSNICCRPCAKRGGHRRCRRPPHRCTSSTCLRKYARKHAPSPGISAE